MKIRFFGIAIFIYIWLTLSLVERAFSQSGATDNSMVNHQLWLDFYPHFFVSEKLEYYGDAGYRTILRFYPVNKPK